MAEASRFPAYGGVGIAVLALVVTRLFVAESLEPDAASFMVAGLVTLAVGLGLTLFGVALAVGAVSRTYTRTVWLWTVLCTSAAVLVLATTAFHTILAGRGLDPLVRAEVLVGNLLLGGAVLGAFVGHRIARSSRRELDLARYAERAMLVNRLLRHEVLNAATVVKGYADRLVAGEEDAASVIRRAAVDIEDRVSLIKEFVASDPEVTAVRLRPVLQDVARVVSDDAATLTTEFALPPGTHVHADQRLALLVRELVENALEHAGPDAAVHLEAGADEHAVTVTVRDDGPGLPEHVVDLLETPGLPETDDPRLGYGLQLVRLLVDHYDGRLDVTSDDGTEIAVTLRRAPDGRSDAVGPGVPVGDLYRVGAAAVVAGVVTGALLAAVPETLATIGLLYSVESPVVGLVAHLFHSVLFGVAFATALRTDRLGHLATSRARYALLGTAWGGLLWLLASLLVAPLWLRAGSTSVAFPTLTAAGLVVHLLWGALLGWLYSRLRERGALPLLEPRGAADVE